MLKAVIWPAPGMAIFRDVLFSFSFALGAVAAAKFVMALVG
jgi:hypothetical protein